MQLRFVFYVFTVFSLLYISFPHKSFSSSAAAKARALAPETQSNALKRLGLEPGTEFFDNLQMTAKDRRALRRQELERKQQLSKQEEAKAGEAVAIKRKPSKGKKKKGKLRKTDRDDSVGSSALHGKEKAVRAAREAQEKALTAFLKARALLQSTRKALFKAEGELKRYRKAQAHSQKVQHQILKDPSTGRRLVSPDVMREYQEIQEKFEFLKYSYRAQKPSTPKHARVVNSPTSPGKKANECDLCSKGKTIIDRSGNFNSHVGLEHYSQATKNQRRLAINKLLSRNTPPFDSNTSSGRLYERLRSSSFSFDELPKKQLHTKTRRGTPSQKPTNTAKRSSSSSSDSGSSSSSGSDSEFSSSSAYSSSSGSDSDSRAGTSFRRSRPKTTHDSPRKSAGAGSSSRTITRVKGRPQSARRRRTATSPKTPQSAAATLPSKSLKTPVVADALVPSPKATSIGGSSDSAVESVTSSTLTDLSEAAATPPSNGAGISALDFDFMNKEMEELLDRFGRGESLDDL